jgi:hypothetical protein
METQPLKKVPREIKENALWRNKEYVDEYFRNYYKLKGNVLETCEHCGKQYTHSHKQRHLKTKYCNNQKRANCLQEI